MLSIAELHLTEINSANFKLTDCEGFLVFHASQSVLVS